MSGRFRLLSSLSVVVVACSAVAVIWACVSGATFASEGGPSGTGSVSPAPTDGSSVSTSPSASPRPTTSARPSASALPTEDPEYVARVRRAKPGGSSVQLKAPCAGGTLTLTAYPDGEGVGLTGRLHPTTHLRWDTWGYVTPYNGYTDEGSFPGVPVEHVAKNGTLVFHATNLSGSVAVGGYDHRWPQSVDVDLLGQHAKQPSQPARVGPACIDSGMYLNATWGLAEATPLTVSLGRRTGTMHLRDRDLSSGGSWQVAVTVRSPSGVRRQQRSVAAQTYTDGIIGHYLTDKVQGLSHLHDFTSITVSVSKHGTHRAWLRLSRTP